MEKSKLRARWATADFQKTLGTVLQALSKEGAVLSEVDMAGISIGKEGPISALWIASLYRARLDNVDLSYADLACSLSEAELHKVSLVGANLDRCLIRKARAIDCDFTDSRLLVSLDDSTFTRCGFSGAKFSRGRAGHEYGGRRAKFSGCDFSGALFKEVEFRASRFSDCIFTGARFIGCDFRGVKVEGGNFPAAEQFEKMDIPDWAM